MLALAAPLALIAAAIAISPWFSLWSNALSDLGHQVRHPHSAKIFNTGLFLGTVFSLLLACKCLHEWRETLLWWEGLSLALVAVFNEAYGPIHFWASVLFFTSLFLMLVSFAFLAKDDVVKSYSVSAAIVYTIIWCLHLCNGIPSGAAVPELLSILLYAPLLIKAVLTDSDMS